MDSHRQPTTPYIPRTVQHLSRHFLPHKLYTSPRPINRWNTRLPTGHQPRRLVNHTCPRGQTPPLTHNPPQPCQRPSPPREAPSNHSPPTPRNTTDWPPQTNALTCFFPGTARKIPPKPNNHAGKNRKKPTRKTDHGQANRTQKKPRKFRKIPTKTYSIYPGSATQLHPKFATFQNHLKMTREKTQNQNFGISLQMRYTYHPILKYPLTPPHTEKPRHRKNQWRGLNLTFLDNL